MPLDKRHQQAFRDLATETEGIDTATYQRFERDPRDPIIGLGKRNARLGFFGRDPGRDEVRHGEPFIGAGGQIVRRVISEHLYGEPPADFDAARQLGRDFFWINTVPYKPSGNKAWSMKVKRRFHPLMRELLITQWEGRTLITLGREAFLWFGIDRPKEERDRLEAFWRREDRFESSIDLTLDDPDGDAQTFTLYPLPHPSPLNQTWYARFPGLLKQRLEQVELTSESLTL